MTPTNTHSVLILDADFAAALVILRSLSRQGIYCDIASAIEHPLCLHSRYAKQHFRYPDPLTDREHFIRFIAQLIQDNPYDLIIPVTERALIPLSESTLFDAWRNRLAIADHDSLVNVLDKTKTLAIARSCNVSVPFSHTVHAIEEVNKILPEISYPVVLKPGQSIPNAKQRRQLSVCYAKNANELIQQCKQLLPYCPLLIQEYALGIGTGIELLANHGKIVYSFQHQRIHELPLTGGGSCLRKSIAVDPVLLQATEKLIATLNWHGVAMVEFKWQPETGKYWLMEINGRFWGSLPLAYVAGADFPKMLFDLYVLNQSPATRPYKENIYCRKLSADIQWLEQVLRRSDHSGLVHYPNHQRVLTDCLLAFHPTRHFFDIQCWYDPLPGLIDFKETVKAYGLRFYDILHYKISLRYYGSRFFRQRLRNQLKNIHSILFLCYGNINRSAVAQAIAEQSLPPNPVTFYSAGFHSPDKRPADPTMVKVAANDNIDLSHWQSHTLSPELIEKSDIILAMEITHLKRLKQDFPNAANKGFLLGCLTAQKGLNSVEISDPYNQPLAIYQQVFTQVKNAIGQLAQLLPKKLT
jgi:protein-tyrosine-phosphatase/predicted ATP-grasp superfamily ATP-dependent carboligase